SWRYRQARPDSDATARDGIPSNHRESPRHRNGLSYSGAATPGARVATRVQSEGTTMYPWLQLGPIFLSTYSLCFLAAFAVGGWVTYREARRLGRATQEVLIVAMGALVGGLIGCKVSMLLFLGPQKFIEELPSLWYSGQAWTGGFFGGYAAVLIVKRWRKIGYSTGDIFACAIPLAQAIGRLGNLLGGDPFGAPTDLPWGIVQ